MKRTLSIICCIILCLSLFACGKPEISKPSNLESEVLEEQSKVELKPNFDASGELNISCYGDGMTYNGGNDDQLAKGVEMFKHLYPNVILNVDRVPFSVTSKDYETKLSDDIKAGVGPDLFWTGGMNTNKMMQSGEFADMSEYFDNDPDFNIKDYNQVVFISGQPKGKQYLIPLSYSFPMFITSNEMLTKSKFDISKCTDYFGCSEEMSRILRESKAQVNDKNELEQKAIVNFTYPDWYPTYTGIDWLDFSNRSISIDTPEMKKVIELYKSNFYDYKNLNITRPNQIGTVIKGLRDKEIVLSQCVDCFDDAINTYKEINNFDKAVMFPLRNTDGKIQALSYNCISVRNNSLNKQNAYYFAKIMLSNEIKFSRYGTAKHMSIPISNIATKQLLVEKFKVDNSLDEKDAKVTLNEESTKFIEQYMEYISEVDSVYYNNAGKKILHDAMKPYLDDEKSYDECIKDAEVKLKKYLSE